MLQIPLRFLKVGRAIWRELSRFRTFSHVNSIWLYFWPFLQQVYIRDEANRILEFEVEPSTTVLMLMEMYERYAGFSIERQQLVFDGHYLEREYTMSDNNIVDESELRVILRHGPPASQQPRHMTVSSKWTVD